MRRCEALVLVKRGSPKARRWEINGMYVPCGAENAELHHKLTRARGGLILDKAGETYHQMWLCREHHAVAHDAPAFDNGLLIRGFVTTGPTGLPIYKGPDEYLNERYGSQVHTP
jgi:hypothetical protein